MIRTIVTITECEGPAGTTVTTHNTPDPETAIRRAVSRRYGTGRGFFEDRVNSRHFNRYGQVGHRVPRKHGGGTTMETGRVYIGIQQEA